VLLEEKEQFNFCTSEMASNSCGESTIIIYSCLKKYTTMINIYYFKDSPNPVTCRVVSQSVMT
jgi:hypothetical protein